MNRQMSRSIVFSGIVFLVIFFSTLSCQKTQVLGEYHLGDLYYENPYNGYETLVFESSEGILFTFTGTGRKTSVYENKVSVNSNDYYVIEKDYMSLEDSDGNYSLGLGLTPYNGYRNEPATIGMGWRDYVSDTQGSLTANSRFIIPLSKQNLESDQMFYDSMLVLNKIYYNVYADYTNQYRAGGVLADTQFAMPEIFYYNRTDGILKIDFNDGSTWELQEIQ
jgi:hypothetical protein